MIDASKGFVKDGNKNRLREQDVHKAVDVFNKQLEVPKYSRMIPVAEIEANDYNLNIPRYIDSSEAEDIQDIEAHLLGGIPNRDIDELASYWQVYPTLRTALFVRGAREGYSNLAISQDEIKQTIFSHNEFVAFKAQVNAVFGAWRDETLPLLRGIAVGAKPKELIHQLSESILSAFTDLSLIDRYDVYQHLMMYWVETMQDDAYLIAVDGWQANPTLIPAQLLVRRYFEAEQNAIEQLEADKDAIVREKEELEEEHSGEEGLLEEVKSDKGKISKGSVQARLKEIGADKEVADEVAVLKTYLALVEKEAAAGKAVKDAQKALDAKVSAKYMAMSEEDVKALVVDDKWLASIENDIHSELDRVSQRLTQRIKELAERYVVTLPGLSAEVEILTDKVDEHLKRMGFVWK